jgi:hypothetical protein
METGKSIRTRGWSMAHIRRGMPALLGVVLPCQPIDL